MWCKHCPNSVKIHPELTSPHKFSLHHTKSHDVEWEYLWIVLIYGPKAAFTANYKKLIIQHYLYDSMCVCAIIHFICWRCSAKALITQTVSFCKVCLSTFLKKCPEPISAESLHQTQFLHVSLYSLVVILYCCFRLSEGFLVVVPFSLELVCVNSKSLIVWIHKTEIFQ